MQATLFYFGPPCLEIISHTLITWPGILERFFETAAAETEIPLPCGARFSHWYHIALQLWTPGPICVGLCNCVQWTWNYVKNKRPIYRISPSICEKQYSHICFLLSGAYVARWSNEEKPQSIWLGRGSVPLGDGGIKHKVPFSVITVVGRWWVKWGGGIILGRDWKAQRMVLAVMMVRSVHVGVQAGRTLT